MVLPQFRLQLVAYPGEQVNLHIFEPRYKQLMHDCEQKQLTFGIVAHLNNHLQKIGTEMILERIARRYQSGELDIVAIGTQRYRISRFYKKGKNKLYPTASVAYINETEERASLYDVQFILERLSDLYKFMNIDKPIPTDVKQVKAFDIAHQAGLNTDQEYHLLTLDSEADRISYIRTHLEQLLPRVKEMELMRRKIQMNGHFRNVIPPDLGDL